MEKHGYNQVNEVHGTHGRDIEFGALPAAGQGLWLWLWLWEVLLPAPLAERYLHQHSSHLRRFYSCFYLYGDILVMRYVNASFRTGTYIDPAGIFHYSSTSVFRILFEPSRIYI
jgi:hypothetical protein